VSVRFRVTGREGTVGRLLCRGVSFFSHISELHLQLSPQRGDVRHAERNGVVFNFTVNLSDL
jgi:hypothetical protein